jgi:hypothetical protein
MKAITQKLRRMFKKRDDKTHQFQEAKIIEYVSSSKIIKLHFGSGPRVLRDWLNIDLAFEPFENYLKYYGDVHYPIAIRGDITDFAAFDVTKRPLPIPSNSVDVIFHEDFIEHLDQREQVLFLAETFRVLKVGGIHRVNTPDLVASMKQSSQFVKGSAGVYVEEWDRHRHKNVLTKSMLQELALIVGYSSVEFTRRNASNSAYLPLEYRPDPNDRPENGNLFADLMK